MTLTLPSRLSRSLSRFSRELKLFAMASLVMGVCYSLVDSTLNNFLNDRYALDGFQRSFLEFPRELPGLLCLFITAALWFLCSRRLGGVSMLLGLAGTVLIGFVSTTYMTLVLCLFIYSLGQHLFMPAASAIGMELAEPGKTGQRLGQLNAIRNVAAILGSFLVFLGFRFLGFNYQSTFALSAIGFAVAAVLMFAMKPEQTQPATAMLKLHKEYRLFYVLNILYGSRKQLFITFAPWVIVTIFKQPTQTIATLITIGGIIGILFQPLLGWVTDHWGERMVLATEAVLLVVVCLGYGFARSVFPEGIAFLLVCAFYLIDQMLMSVGMARSMYMKKIALQPGDVQPALTAGITIDHIFSISVALLGGVIWNAFGFQYVFLLGVVIAAINFFVALQVRVPRSVDIDVQAAPAPAAQ
jgi:predicted MFS family arabinose efflux permease